MFENNLLTFNPGWTQDAKPLAAFTDVRELQRQRKGHSLSMISEANEASTGPASLMIADPDRNMILVEQHVSATRSLALFLRSIRRQALPAI